MGHLNKRAKVVAFKKEEPIDCNCTGSVKATASLKSEKREKNKLDE